MKFIASFVGHFIFLAVFFWWTGIGDDSKSSVALSIAVAVVWPIALAIFEYKLFSGARWSVALRRPEFWAAVALCVASVVIARVLTTSWIPQPKGLPWQLTSFVLRFGLAWTLLNAAWVNLARQAGAPPSHDTVAAAASN